MHGQQRGRPQKRSLCCRRGAAAGKYCDHRSGADGKVSITDGPFAETKEQLAGFYLIEAEDLNDAIQVASRIPPARVGSIEVRPVRQLVASGGAERAASEHLLVR